MLHIRYGKRRHFIHVFAFKMEHRSTGHQDLEFGTGHEELSKQRSGWQHLLKIVQQQQELFGAQERTEVFEEGTLPVLLESKCMCNGGDDKVGITDGSQRHKTHTMGEFLQHIAPKGQGQACLADARGAGQGEHAHPGTCEPGTHCLEYLLAPNEWCERVRQSDVAYVPALDQQLSIDCWHR